MFNRKEQSYALDNIRYSAGAVAAWTSQRIYAAQLYMVVTGVGGRGADYSVDLRPPVSLRSAL
jgi:hypothetical protein